MNTEEITATLEAEEILIGSILLEASAARNAIPGIKRVFGPEMLSGYGYKGMNLKRFYSAMLNCVLPDSVSVANELARTNTLLDGDCSYLYHIQLEVPCSLEYIHYAEIVRDYYLKRQGKTERGNPRHGRSGGVEI
jgi:replicative DNA helicase